MGRSEIVEKVKFWEEQDRINEALIPRVLEMHETLKKVSKDHIALNESFEDLFIKHKDIVEKLALCEHTISELTTFKREAVPITNDPSTGKLSIYISIIAVIISIVSLFVA